MKTRRKERLREFLSAIPAPTSRERRALLIARSRLTKGRVTQLLNDGFGELAGVNLAKQLGIPDQRTFEREVGTPFDAPWSSPPLRVEDARLVYSTSTPPDPLEHAIEVLAAAIAMVPDSRKEAIGYALRILSSSPTQWPEVVAVIRGLIAASSK